MARKKIVDLKRESKLHQPTVISALPITETEEYQKGYEDGIYFQSNLQGNDL